MKDPLSLPDIQYSLDTRAIELDNVGISDYLTRINIQDESGADQLITARCSLSTNLEDNLKGSHLSRFVEASSFFQERSLSKESIDAFLELLLNRLESNSASLELSFDYLFNKAAPVSGKKALVGCEVIIEANKQRNETAHCSVKLTVPVSTTCPCSKAISEEGAHNQRTNISIALFLAPGAAIPSISELYSEIELCGSAPVYPLLKRPDEKFVTELQFRNPKFVEDVAREVILTLRQRKDLIGYSLQIESLESIHSHNAFVTHNEFFN